MSVFKMFGFDGCKMFKFYNNYIGLCDSEDEVMIKVRMMLIDFVCVWLIDLGELEKCLVW